MTLNGQWIELFRAGDYGDRGSYSVADIDKMIANYNPATHEAPVVMGHPEHDAPAYGWVEALKRVGSVLMGKLKQVPDQFAQLVREGRFKKRSISFYRGENGPSLRHVGFLGAMPPEVKGLADVKLASFSAGEFQAIDFKEEEMDADQIGKSITTSLKEFFTELFKGKKLEEVTLTDQSKAIADAVTAATAPLQAKFTEIENQLKAEKAARETAAAAGATQTQAAFAEKQIQRVKEKQRWLPAFDKMGLPQIFTELAKVGSKLTFGEGDKKTEKPAAEAFADFMINLGEFVPTGELVDPSENRRSNVIQFNEPTDAHTAVDLTSVSMAEAAKKLAEEKKISFGEALKQVRRSGEFTPAGGVASGHV